MEMPVPFRCPRRSRGGVAWWCLGLLLALVATAQAELQFDVFVGYGLGASDGVAAEGAWMPVTCEIYNDGPSFNGVVELNSTQASQRYSVAVELPTGTRKRVLIPMYVSGRWFTLEARLRDGRGKVRAQHNQLQLRLITDRNSPLIGSLSRTLGGSVTLPEKRPDNANHQLVPGVARLSPELFPDHPMALEGLSVLYLHPARAVELKAGQVTALLAWLHGGGHLIVAAEQVGEINAVPWLRQILPCEITGVAPQSDHSVLQAWLNADSRRPLPGQVVTSGPARVARPTRQRPNAPPVVVPNPPEATVLTVPAEPNPFVQLPTDAAFESASMLVATATLRDGKVLLGSESSPLAIQCERGRGTLTVLLFSPELEPFKSWGNRSWFWAKLGGVPIEWLGGWKFARASGASVDGVFGALIDSRQIRKLPIGWLFVLLLAYLAVIGPVDQYVLKKLNRQMLTWVTFPAYVAFFSVLIYYIGYKLRAGETEWNEFHVIDVVPHGQRADLRGHSYGSVYSPANAQYPVASDAPYATLRGERDLYGQEMSRVEIEQQGNTFKGRLNAPIWTSQLFLTDWWRQDKLPLSVTITTGRNSEQIKVTVENLTGRRIPQACLVVNQRIYDLGELPASKTLEFHRSTGEALDTFTTRYSNQFQNAVNQRRSQFGNEDAHLSDFYNSVSALSFVSLVKPRQQPDQFQPYQQTGVVASRDFDLAACTARGDAVLLAWLPGETLVAPLNRFTPRRSHRDTMLRVIVPAK